MANNSGSKGSNSNCNCLGITTEIIPYSIGGCSASINQESCVAAYDQDESSTWAVTSPSWIMLHLDYPTTLNMIRITYGDIPCTEVMIELELGDVSVQPLVFNLDVLNYIIKENIIITSEEDKEVELKFMDEEKIAGVRLKFSLPTTCNIQEISLTHSTGTQESTTGKRYS